ncbi:unnamed protein product, partial [Prorocentrum cordatum]
ARRPQPLLALRLLEEARARRLEPSLVSCNAAISACEKGGWWRQALELFGSMAGQGLRPDAVSYNALAGACEKGDQWALRCTSSRRCGSEPSSRGSCVAAPG